MVIAAYSITPQRRDNVEFAGPYFRARQDIMVTTGDASITGVNDLTDKRACTARGSTSLQNLLNRNPKVDVVLRDPYSECATALLAGDVDAVTTDQPILAGYAHQSGGALKVLNNPFSVVSDELYGVGIPKGDTGGLGELVGVFDDEDAARAAFAALGLRAEPVAAWGAHGAIDSPGSCAVLCWFGHERPVPHRATRRDNG